MDNVQKFKEFVRKNPSLIKYVRTGEMTWQKFYEIYNLYGEDESAWKDYLTPTNVAKATTVATSGLGFGELFSMFKNIDLDSIQNGVNSIQRFLSVLQDFTSKGTNDSTRPRTEYKPRPLYKHFED